MRLEDGEQASTRASRKTKAAQACKSNQGSAVISFLKVIWTPEIIKRTNKHVGKTSKWSNKGTGVKAAGGEGSLIFSRCVGPNDEESASGSNYLEISGTYHRTGVNLFGFLRCF